MEKLCKFAVLKYVPDEIRKEFINIGLVFHSPEDHFVDIKLTTNFSRVYSFDDEMNIDFLKLVLEGVKTEFSREIIHGCPSFNDLGKWDFLDCATSFYSNQLQFSPIYTIRSNAVEKDFEDLFRTYVYFDTHKKKRITSEQVKSIMNRVLRDKSVISKLNRDVCINIGVEDIVVDYQYESQDDFKLVKTFSFDYTNRGSNTASQVAKEWAWNYSKMRSASTLNQLNAQKKVQIVTFVYLGKRTKSIEIALDILRGESGELVQADHPEEIEMFADKITHEIQN